MASEPAPLLIEQLSKALLELEACNAASSDKVQWKEMEEHFLNLDAAFKKKIWNLYTRGLSNLEASYDLEPLQKRLEQLENKRTNKKRGAGGDHSRKVGLKKLKLKGGGRGGPHNNKHRAGPAAAFVPRGVPFSDTVGRYTQPPSNHVAHHPFLPDQSTYSHSQQPFDPRSFNAATTTYPSYM